MNKDKIISVFERFKNVFGIDYKVTENTSLYFSVLLDTNCFDFDKLEILKELFEIESVFIYALKGGFNFTFSSLNYK